MKKIVLCSRHPMLTAGFRHVIVSSDEFSLSVCTDAALLREHVLNEAADIVLADMTCDITLQVLRDLRAGAPAAAVVLWVDNVHTEFVSQAISLGVLGVLRKNAETDHCLNFLRQVGEGKLAIENELSRKLLSTRKIKLTPRERQLMGLLAQGLKNKELAYRLGITEGTVKVYLSHLYEKVGASDRFELALLALKNMATDQTTAAKGLESSKVSDGFLMPGFVSFEQRPSLIQ